MKIQISVCMGSSCYPRGNRTILEFLKKLVKEKQWDDLIELRGHLCEGNCKEGPVIKIDDKLFKKVTELSILDLVKNELEVRGRL